MAGQIRVDLLLRLLDERIASDETPEDEKGRLQRVRDSVSSLGRDLAVKVLGAYLARMTPGDGGDGG